MVYQTISDLLPLRQHMHIIGNISLLSQHDSGNMDRIQITPSQCRGARGMVGISRKDLADKASIAERTLTDFEREARAPNKSTLFSLQAALESLGIEFLDGDGVRLRKAAGEP